RPEMAPPTVIFATTQTAPSSTTGNVGLRFTAGPARMAQTEGFDIAAHNHVVSVPQSRSHFPAQSEPPRPTVISFDEGTTPCDILKVDSHSGSSDMEVEMVERESKLPDLEAHPPTDG
ncbi:hypothetical protein FRC06_003356, partial [Ceratobasidium sp. 370]